MEELIREIAAMSEEQQLALLAILRGDVPPPQPPDLMNRM